MSIPLSELSWLLGDASDVVVQLEANDPRFCPTEALLVVANSSSVTVAQLDRLPNQFRDECHWGNGHEARLEKTSGGIGADGVTVISLLLGVVGAVPTVESIFEKLHRRTPELPDRAFALRTATWAVSMQYQRVPRSALKVLREERHRDHWTFAMSLPESGDTFEVDVYGHPGAGATATRVCWQSSDGSRRPPGDAP